MDTDSTSSSSIMDPRVQRLVDAVRTRDGLRIRRRGARYGHMGATLTDAALQARWNYTRVVLPRAMRVRDYYPEAATTSGFRALIADTAQAHKVLQTRHAGKVAIAQALARAFANNEVETEEQLRVWIARREHRRLLRAIPGVGLKTVAYLALLAGDRHAVKLDVHVERFLRAAGVWGDDGVQLVRKAASTLEVAPADLDAAIWRYQRRQQLPHSSQQSMASTPSSG